jgi:hypothetical protein
MSETPNAAPVAGVLAGHGILLAACGVYGSYSSNWAPKAMHSAYAGLGGCAILLLSAGMSVGGTRKLYMIGVHVGLLFQLMFTGANGWLKPQSPDLSTPLQLGHTMCFVCDSYVCAAFAAWSNGRECGPRSRHPIHTGSCSG